MAKILKNEGRNEQYIRLMLEVCYLDLNGPNNCGDLDDPTIRRQYPPFNPKDGMLAPGIIRLVSKMISDLKIQPNQLRDMFLEVAAQAQASLKLTLSPDKAWRKLKKGIAT